MVDVGSGAAPGIWATWNSLIPGTIKDHEPQGRPLTDEDPAAGRWVTHVPFPENARPLLGEHTSIRLSATPWR
ncbi:hypothetical protein [Streptomyces glaucescens]|uniref:hypothetical protein n=1 Tax=Streptomyces glaucescens TaxID=1907 RepID=UPI0030D98814